ncbi:MAG: hypothetical protein A3K19_16285 [Lentisphaerae bacterium RIFOXYB12_FULL_65_16]|nr:MAG: hypothetical protein A3K18_20590 [Lentisphaerae bacterium RIFOXYA12_64_32]OGV84493.1 MAG: hypothetical protein A3K19_16285 [Lentisphaerae bacterium RIFOXYB12_FULL_65_16]
MIAPIRQSTLADTVEARLRQFIRKQRFRPGDALPKETELAAQLKVSRNVVREALSRLRMLGIVESRRRRGMVLAGADIPAVLRRMIHPQLVPDSQDLFELRLVLELGLVDLLFLRRQEFLIRDLERIVRREEAVPGDLRLNQQCEIAFHSAIYAATGNTLLVCFQELLQPFFRDARGRHFAPDRFATPKRPNHRHLIEALRQGDVEEYRRLMRQHLSPYFDDLPRVRSGVR